MSFLFEKCSFRHFDKLLSEACAPFNCGDNDLDEFFTQDAFMQSEQLLCKNYCFTTDDDNKIVCAFTLSNDSIKKIPGSRKKKVEKNIPREKQYSSYPAVLVGRLGVNVDYQSHHIGSDVLDFIKAWFVDPLNKTGCRFVLIDSYNNSRNLSFYEKNGFQFLFGSEEQEKEFRNIKKGNIMQTRLMYFDLIQLKSP